MAASVEVDCGPRRVRRFTAAPRGEPHDPLGWHELVAKFNELAAVAYDAPRRNRIVTAIGDLDRLDGTQSLTRELGS
jgi:2-methylcitrate dehydratase PrpD